VFNSRANDVYLQTQHKLTNVTNKLRVKTAINAQFKKIAQLT